MFCTTFPCHNCAKHIIASGIKEVVYVEPYPKSKAIEFHSDAVTTKKERERSKMVRFKPFVGVGPRQFFDLFSLQLGSGRPIARQDSEGKPAIWKEDRAIPRIPMPPISYLEFEKGATAYLDKVKGGSK